MKKLYTLFTFLAISICLQRSVAQCHCSDGSTPDSLSYSQYFDSIVTTNTTISFPQFDPAMGTLTCFKLSDTVSTVVSYNLQNNLPDTTIYNFETFRRSQFTGPGSFFSSVTSTPKDFGPYTLSPMDSAGDNVDIGPDTVFNKQTSQKYGSSNPAFYGTGTVDFNYLNTSTFTILTGSDNAIFILRAYTRLNVTLVYYWCPSSVLLATHLTNFTTSLLDNGVLLQWKINDPRPTDKCEIEMSTDGKEFKNLGEGTSTLSGSLSSYKFVYTPDKNFTGNLLFRIKQTDYAGRVLYSEIRTASISKNNKATYSLYPNPSITGINIQFMKTSGDYEVELINSFGQLNFQKKYSLNQNSSINIEWSHKPAAGIYFLKVRDLRNNTEQVERLKIM